MTPRLAPGARLRRLLAILAWLAGHGEATVSEVAARFAMSDDEVVAELELAACCGLPPYTPDQLMELTVGDGWVTADVGPLLSRPVRFSAEEGFAVAASARALLAVPGSDPDGALGRALRKLEAVLGDKERVAVELDAPFLLEECRRAARERATLRVDYYSASRDEATTRDVDPYGVYSSGGHWYLDAYCHRAGGLRHFRVDRIESAEITGAHFEPPAWSPPAEVFQPGPEATVATVLLPEPAAWLLEGHPVLSRAEEPDGRVRVEIAVGGEAWLARLLLRAGPGGEVVDPPELADAGRRAAAAVLEAYG